MKKSMLPKTVLLKTALIVFFLWHLMAMSFAPLRSTPVLGYLPHAALREYAAYVGLRERLELFAHNPMFGVELYAIERKADGSLHRHLLEYPRPVSGNGAQRYLAALWRGGTVPTHRTPLAKAFCRFFPSPGSSIQLEFSYPKYLHLKEFRAGARPHEQARRYTFRSEEVACS